MAEQLTPARLAEIEARAEAAFQGPWVMDDYGSDEGGSGIIQHNFADHPDQIHQLAENFDKADGLFAASARADVPALCAAVRGLLAMLVAQTGAGDWQHRLGNASRWLTREEAEADLLRLAASRITRGTP